MCSAATASRSASTGLDVGSLPRAIGLGLRHEHAAFWRGEGAELGFDVGFAEIHAENFMMEGGPHLDLLEHAAQRYPISVHGVALSLGGSERPDRDHLCALKRLLAHCHAASFSEHLAWSSFDGTYFNDLLPLPYTSASLSRVAANIDETQTFLGRPLLLENPALYLQYSESDWDEVDFLAELAQRTGCGLLLDVNNVAVSAANLGFDARGYLERFPLHLVGEVHIAGHDLVCSPAGNPILIDAHGSPVSENVWSLLAIVLERAGPLPILLERDNDIPPIAALLPEIVRAQELLAQSLKNEACHAFSI